MVLFRVQFGQPVGYFSMSRWETTDATSGQSKTTPEDASRLGRSSQRLGMGATDSFRMKPISN